MKHYIMAKNSESESPIYIKGINRWGATPIIIIKVTHQLSEAAVYRGDRIPNINTSGFAPLEIEV